MYISKFFEASYFSIFTDYVQAIHLNVLFIHVKILQFTVHCVVLKTMLLNKF
jgi:hypothetical protein